MTTSDPTTGEIAGAIRVCENKLECDVCPMRNKPCGDLYTLAADRLESQEREIERLRGENDALYRAGMGRDGVFIPIGEYQPITFAGIPIADAITMVKGFAALTARAEQAEKERDAAKADMKMIADAARETHCDEICCFACKYDCDTSINDSGEFNNECPGFDKDDCFEWRGPQAEEGDKDE